MPDFMTLALVGGLLITLISAPVGTFMLWRRMAYFGDALAHTTLLGLGIGIWLQLPIQLSLLVVTLIVAISITRIKQGSTLGTDTFIAIAAHSSLALGMLAIALLPAGRIDLMGYLFGDLLSLTDTDLLLLTAAAAIGITTLVYHWRGLVMNSLNPELAQLAGYHNAKLNLILAILIAVVVAISTKLVGALLMTALLITPAAIARRWSTTPQSMIIGAVIIGWIAIAAGLALSWHYDLPVSPAIVSILFAGFIISRFIGKRH
jgi:zinc transport system permease protein